MQVVAVRARGVVCKFVHLADGRRDRLQHQSQRKEPQHENAQERQPAMGAKTGHGRAGYRTTGGYTISFETPFPTNNAAMHASEASVRSVKGHHRREPLGSRTLKFTNPAPDRKSTRPELQSLMRIPSAVFCLKKKNHTVS